VWAVSRLRIAQAEDRSRRSELRGRRAKDFGVRIADCGLGIEKRRRAHGARRREVSQFVDSTNGQIVNSQKEKKRDVLVLLRFYNPRRKVIWVTTLRCHLL